MSDCATVRKCRDTTQREAQAGTHTLAIIIRSLMPAVC